MVLEEVVINSSKVICQTDFSLYVLNGIASSKQKMTCGLPQGSFLGPTLFSLYVNDLPKITEFSVRLFADDTVMVMSDNSLEKSNNEVKIIDEWLTSNKLTLNTSKTSFMLFHLRK